MPSTTIAPTTATRKLWRSKPLMLPHDQFGDSAGNKTKDNPGDDTHSDALLQV